MKPIASIKSPEPSTANGCGTDADQGQSCKPAATVIRRIVVGIDGSDLSRYAFAVAAMIAEAAHIEIRAIHVLESINGDGTNLAWDPAAIERHAAIIGVRLQDGRAAAAGGFAPARRMIDECAAFCRAQSTQFSSGFMFGPLLDRLLELDNSDLLVLGKGRFGHAGIGSTTRRLLHDAHCPVLIVSGQLLPVNRVVCAFDGSLSSDRVLAVGRALAAQTRWPLTILAVAGHLTMSAVFEAAHGQAPGAHIIACGPEDSDEVSQIEKAASLARMGLMVVPTFSDSWISKVFHGGMLGDLLARMSAPVLFVH